ncbi:MAG: 50S ribosomal protein L30 [candidate division WOR-3 bacterium]|jgi:large subunit ribosomal protein L30|nr:50S ribosomal protein L30 [candidate division WOR-3 bacterium]MCR4424399.1 50S ribosomal protein L30 [candidate division WOR-3 bacterium]MDH7518217.1 50S ribosomal protein L30 [bacterium]
MKKLKVKLIKSLIDEKEEHKRTARALGLRRLGAERVHNDSPVVRGMIFKIRHLVKVEEL